MVREIINQFKTLERVRRNDVSLKNISGIFQDFEDFCMPGFARTNSPENSAEAVRLTRLLMGVLVKNKTLEQFTINMQSLELIGEDASPIVVFLQNNPNLKTLNLRIPPKAHSSKHLIFSKKVVCKALKEIIITLPPEYRRLHESSIRAGARRQTLISRRWQQPRYTSSCKQYNLKEISKFISHQPSLVSIRIIDSSFTAQQWETLSAGIAASRSLQSVELQRVESLPLLRINALAKHPTIKCIKLGECSTRLDWYQVLERNTTLQQLRLSTPVLESECLRRLASLLSVNSAANLSLLEIRRVNLCGYKATVIAQMLESNTTLEELILRRTHLDGRDGALLARSLQSNSSLKRLALDDNNLWRSPPTAAFAAFQTMLRENKTLEHLDLSDNGFDVQVSDNRFSMLFDGLLHNNTLRFIKVSNQANMFLETLHRIFGQGLRSLNPMVSENVGQVMALNKCLQELNLNYNHLGDDAIAQYLGPGLRSNTSLRVLGLKHVGMANPGLIALSKALKNNTHLQLLDVSFNADLSESGYAELKNTLVTMTEIHTLWFHTTRRRGDENREHLKTCAAIISEALEKNVSLVTLSHSDILTRKAKIYLDLNRRGRKHLYKGGSGIKDVLWPIILNRMSDSVIALDFTIRQNADFFASLSHRISLPSARKRRRL